MEIVSLSVDVVLMTLGLDHTAGENISQFNGNWAIESLLKMHLEMELVVNVPGGLYHSLPTLPLPLLSPQESIY